MMKLLFDWAPLVVFFVAFKLEGIYVATGLSILTSLVFMAYMRLKRMPIDKMQWLSLGLIVVFGGLTLVLQDERFIKLKPTLLYGASALALLIPQLLGRTLLLRSLLGDKIELSDKAWRAVNLSWVAFFALMASLNLWVAYEFSTEVWVEVKVFGGIGLLLLFVLAQSVLIARLQRDSHDAS